MQVLIPSEIVNQTGMSEQEVLTEISVLFFQMNKLSLGKAAKLSGLHQFQFQKVLANRKIPLHYDKEDLQQDLINLQKL
jgi:predicted HTH domain antitoxin